MSWDVVAFRKLVVAKYGQGTMDKIEENISTLQWNLDKVILHKRVIEEECSLMKSVGTNDHRFKEAYSLAMAEGESIIHSLNSIADVFAHIINVILETNQLSSNDVSFNNVLKKLRSTGRALDVVNAMDALINCNEFKYVKAFCNTVKHYNLIDGSFHTHIDIRDSGPFISGMRFNNFEYKDDSFPKVDLKNIYDGYANVIQEKVVAIGRSLNAYLIAYP